ncbi:MAG: hypothetical protein GY705_05280 [Bacteroidetes bacterium]|nr:hypothetical protein [Bacteroidota bacterium]
MIKLLLLAGIIYLYYKFVIQSPSSNDSLEEKPKVKINEKNDQKEGDYIDYEEID